MIQTITAYDIKWIVECLQDMRGEIPACALVEDDYDYVYENVAQMQVSENFIGLCSDNRRAFIFGCLSGSWYDRRLKAYEQLLYVEPQYRNSTLGSRLITQFCNEARTRGAVEVIAGTSIGFKKDAVVALYKRKGFSPIGESLSLKIE